MLNMLNLPPWLTTPAFGGREIHLLTCLTTAHPLQCFQMKLRESQSNWVIFFFKFLLLITAYILYDLRFFLGVPALFWKVLVSWVSMSIHIVCHLPTSGDRSNSYHPTQFSDCSFPLAVALWFHSYVSMSAAFLLKSPVANSADI